MAKKNGEPEILRCSFCNKDQNDVRKLIAGPTVFICDECVEVCNDIIADDSRLENKTTRSSLPVPQEIKKFLDEYVVGQLNHGFQYISQALDLERFTMFTFSPVKQRLDLLLDHVRTATQDGRPVREDPRVRSRMARLATAAEVARGLGLRVVDASVRAERDGGSPPTVEASEYKLFTTEFSKQLADASMDLGGPGTQLRVGTKDAPMDGRAESTYRYTVLDTIGGGTSEVQKNIITRRGLGLPKNF